MDSSKGTEAEAVTKPEAEAVIKPEAEIVTVDVHAARILLESGHLYLDVRTEEEFKNGHVEKAFNIPYMFNTPQGRVKNPKFLVQVSSCHSKEDRLVVGCQSGVRSVYATTDLLNAGFKHACNMGGGYISWAKSGFVVKKPNLDVPLSIPMGVNGLSALSVEL